MAISALTRVNQTMIAHDPWLELQSVEAWLGNRQVFANLSLTLLRGQHAAVLGPNGAGKSTLLRLITREIHPVVRPGSFLRLFGQERIVLSDLQRRLGVVSPALEQRVSPALPVAEVVGSGWFGSVGLGRLHQLSRSQADRVAEDLADHGLADLADRRFGQLSDGQRRRVLLARALVQRPEVLVLDEPLNGLDLRARHQLLGELRQLAAAGTTLLLVTHQIEAVVPEISCCVLLRQGELAAIGTPAEVLQNGPLSALFATPLQVVEANGYRQVLPA